MTRLKAVPAKRLWRALQRLGFAEVSTKGSHVKLRRVTPSGVRTVILPMHRTVSPGVIESILELGGISEEELKALL